MTTKQQREQKSRTYNTFCAESVWFDALGGYVEKTRLLDTLHRYETTLNRINENDANGHPRPVKEVRDGKRYEYDVEDVVWTRADEKKEQRIQSSVREIAEKLGFAVRFNGDPRGGAIRFVLPSGASNNFDGETWGIYW
jgi:hypothetical protein